MNMFMTFVINVLGNNLFPGFIVTQFLEAVACLVKEQVLCIMDLPNLFSVLCRSDREQWLEPISSPHRNLVFVANSAFVVGFLS